MSRTAFASLSILALAFAACSSNDASNALFTSGAGPASAPNGGASAGGGSNATGGSNGGASGGTTHAGGSTSNAGSTSKGGSTSSAGATSNGGTTSSGGATPSGGTTSNGGMTDIAGASGAESGGATQAGGTSGEGGQAGASAGNGGSNGGGGDVGGSTGTSGAGGATGPVCGNGIKETGEACDGADLAGQSCATLVSGGSGQLACTPSCTFDTSNCVSGGGGQGGTTGTSTDVICGPMGDPQSPTCDVSMTYCCLSSVDHTQPGHCGNLTGLCGDGTLSGGTKLSCDSSAQCSNGEVCCGQKTTVNSPNGQKTYYQTVQCQSQCDPMQGQVVFCDPTAPQCPDFAPVCKQSQLLPTGFFVCAPM